MHASSSQVTLVFEDRVLNKMPNGILAQALGVLVAEPWQKVRARSAVQDR